MYNNNIEIWSTFWKKSQADASLFNEEVMKKKWDKRSETFGQKGKDPLKTAERADQVFAFIKENNFDIRNKKVLDIGCGTGALALPLARMGAEVTAVDISSGMLQQIEVTAKSEELNIHTVVDSWWTADLDALGIKGCFDLVLAARTPAIRDAESLEKMMACSREACLFIGFIRKSDSSVHSDISRFILKEKYQRNMATLYLPFMYLYLKGYQPAIRLNFQEKREEIPWAQAAEETMEFLASGREFAEHEREQILAYFEDRSQDGLYTSIKDKGEGMLFWKV